MLRMLTDCSCFNTVLMPQILSEAVENQGYVTQPVADFSPRTENRYPPGLLEFSEVSLCYITVHEEVKPEVSVKEEICNFSLIPGRFYQHPFDSVKLKSLHGITVHRLPKQLKCKDSTALLQQVKDTLCQPPL